MSYQKKLFMQNVDTILYVSCLCSSPVLHKLFDSAKEKPHPAPQKYHSLLVKGLVANGMSVTCLVALPVTVRSHPTKKWWKRSEEFVDGVKYVYIPFYNQPYIKILVFKLFAFYYTILWAFRAHGSKAMICDVLNAHASSSMMACRLMGVKTAGIVTDIPGLMVGQRKSSIIRRWFIKRNLSSIKKATHLIPLTDAMCDIINPVRKIPYIIVEGIVDSNLRKLTPTPYQDGKRHITYTGTLEARYGVRTMVEAFMQLPQNDIVLDIYGRGPMEIELRNYATHDQRIHFHGMVTLEESVIAQRSSYLLVNPRPTNEEFTKYSFPSKNMEYMATGVPLLTAVLPGMPKEYYPYVFLFKDESVEGLSSKMNEILSMPVEKVREIGINGKRFVMENKNEVHQAEKVLQLLDK